MRPGPGLGRDERGIGRQIVVDVSLRTRLLLGFVLTVGLTGLVSTVVGTWLMNRVVTEQAQLESRHDLESARLIHDHALEQVQSKVERVAHDPDLRRHLREGKDAAFRVGDDWKSEPVVRLALASTSTSTSTSMISSGGLIVMGEDTCIVDTTRYYVSFLARESCGQCIPCREGLRQLSKILDDMVEGRGKPGDIETMAEICELLSTASLCALGKTAPNPVRSALRHFRDEFLPHGAPGSTFPPSATTTKSTPPPPRSSA